jgi:hypothetical protein
MLEFCYKFEGRRILMILAQDSSFGGMDYYPSYFSIFEGELKLPSTDCFVALLLELRYVQFHSLREIRFHPFLQLNPLISLKAIFSWHQLILSSSMQAFKVFLPFWTKTVPSFPAYLLEFTFCFGNSIMTILQ